MQLICISAFLVGSVSFDIVAFREGLPLKLFWAYLSVAITLTGYSIYIAQMFPQGNRAPIRPQPLSWIGFGFLTAAGWIIQSAQGARAGGWCLGVTAGACFVIGFLSHFRFPRNLDSSSLTAAAAGVVLFAFSAATRRAADWATFSSICAALADLAFYEPTVRKAWVLPHEESATNFFFNSVKCVPALLALSAFTIPTMLYLCMLTAVNGAFAIFLLVRRMQVAPNGGARGERVRKEERGA
jgi:hypothetical protein